MNTSGRESQQTEHLREEEAPAPALLPPAPAAPQAASAHTDDHILAALARRDRSGAATLLVTEYGPTVGLTCMALLGSQSEAVDALQQTLHAALERWQSFGGEGTRRAWLLSIARRHAAGRIEARARERKRAVVMPEAGPDVELPSHARRARELLDAIRPTERDALVLRFASGLSFPEVGQACGIDEATARKRVSRGLVRLSQLLDKDTP